MPETRTMYIELRDPADPAEVRAALENAGLRLHDLREVTRNQDGYILTGLLARGIWEWETGQGECAGRCEGRAPDEDRHLPGEKLTESQRDAFLERLTGFLGRARMESMDARVLLGRTPELEGVELAPHWK